MITCVQNVEYIRELLDELGCTQYSPTQVFCDNKSTVDLATDPISHQRTKQLRKAMHYVRDCREKGIILPTQIGTNDQEADMFTKNQPVAIFEHKKSLLNLK